MLALVASVASAQDVGSIALSWEAPKSCPDERTVRARIQSHLSSDYRTQQDWVAHGRVVVEHARLRLELTVRGNGGEAHKTLLSASCESLADAAALLIALALDPNAAGARGAGNAAEVERPAAGGDDAPQRDAATARAPGTATAPHPGPSSAARSIQPKTPVRSAGASRSPRAAERPAAAATPVLLGVGIGAALQIGMLPATPAAGLRAHGLVQLGRLRAGAALTLLPEAGAPIDGLTHGRLEARGVLGALEVGWELIAAPAQVQPCALLELGELWVETSDISSPASATTTWLAAGGGLRGAYRVGKHLELAIEALAVAPFRRPRWWLWTSPGEVEGFTAAPLGLRAHAGVVYLF